MKRYILPTFTLLSLAAATRADSLIVQGMSPQKVTITGFDGAKLRYVTPRGDPGDRDYARLQQIVVDAEPALSDAEAKRAAKQTEGALDAYTQAVRETTTPWVKAFAAKRIGDLAGPNGRFEARLAAFIGLTQIASPDAPAAKPELPPRGSRLLDVAVTQVENALKQPQLADGPKTALLDFLVGVHERRGDEAAVVATVERLARASPAAGDPVVQQRLFGLKVGQARLALDRKDYTAAVKLIDDARASINDPKQQSDALFVLASAKLALAGPADKPAQQDAALAFMRVVALANTLPDRPNVLASLKATAGILERTGDPAAAARLYGQIARDFPDAAAEAKADAARLAEKK